MGAKLDIRKDRIDKAGGYCEICGFPGAVLHHIFPGRKNRKISECFETVRFLCRNCHSYIHGQGWDTLQKLQREASAELVAKIGEDETRKLIGGLYF